MSDKKPNVLFVMTDQQRFDTIAALGNTDIYTPNLDRLVRRGIAFTNGYSSCPVCVPARYTVRTGCEPPTTRSFGNGLPILGEQHAKEMEERCGPYIGKRMRELGYRTFGIGKSHSHPWDENLGYDVHLHSEELYGTMERRKGDAYASWLEEEHPAFDHLEGLMGERTEMYYMPQMSAQPAELTVESWAADRAVEQISIDDERPYFGFVSFIGPHPPFAPPIPFNRMYDPDRMPNPVKGDKEADLMDQQIPMMNDIIWAEDINDSHARVLKARYYGEISYIDDCLGRILDAVDSRDDADNTVICFFADHGDHMGDHHGWQKESFFEGSAHVPFLVSWPTRLAKGETRDELVCLADLFGIATGAAGATEIRDGIDVLGMVAGEVASRDHVFGYYGNPNDTNFKMMVRGGEWKYIFFANGGQEQLFNLKDDPNELKNLADERDDVAKSMREVGAKQCESMGLDEVLEDGDLKVREYVKWEWTGRRVYQFDGSKGVHGFPDEPGDAVREWKSRARGV